MLKFNTHANWSIDVWISNIEKEGITLNLNVLLSIDFKETNIPDIILNASRPLGRT